jgi:riboflavin biosynthesis pyrimidine reductase
MRALLPRPIDPVDIHDHYADGWLASGGIRANFVASVDGAASAGGLSRGLQTSGDNLVFAALRDLADVVLVGAGTARAEGYRAVRLSAAKQSIRRSHGLAPALPIAVVSQSARLDPDSDLFRTVDPDTQTIVITCATAGDDAQRALRPVADVVLCGEDTVDLAAMRARLMSRGLTRILCEGGPSLFADLAQAGEVDELCLSITPLLAGPGPGRITAGAAWSGDPTRLDLMGLLELDGALFGRYRIVHRD